MKYFLILLSIISLFSGCAKQPEKIVKKPVPKWVYSTAPQNNSLYLYGMSIGNDRENSISLALSDMVSKLGVEIESQYESIAKENNYSYTVDTTNNIKSTISSIKINNYQIVKSYKVNYKEFAILLQSDKKQFKKGLLDNLNLEIKKMDTELFEINKMDVLSRYNIKKEKSIQSNNLIPTILMIKQLDSTFDSKKYLDYINKLEKDFISEKNKLTFSINGNDNSYKFNNIIKNHLNSKGFNVLENKNKDTIEIIVNVNDNYVKEKVDSSISKNNIEITIFDIEIQIFDKNNEIGGNNLILKERYKNNIISVYKNAVLDFERTLENKLLKDTIGLNLN